MSEAQTPATTLWTSYNFILKLPHRRGGCCLSAWRSSPAVRAVYTEGVSANWKLKKKVILAELREELRTSPLLKCFCQYTSAARCTRTNLSAFSLQTCPLWVFFFPGPRWLPTSQPGFGVRGFGSPKMLHGRTWSVRHLVWSIPGWDT